MTAPMRKVIEFEPHPTDEKVAIVRLDCGHTGGTISRRMLAADSRAMYERAGLVPHRVPCFRCKQAYDEAGRVPAEGGQDDGSSQG